MKPRHLLVIAGIALVSSAATLIIEHLLQPTAAVAQQNTATMQEFVLSASPRRDTEKNESFMFYNSRTGDIWVYEDDKVKEHYRVKEIGKNLEKTKLD